MVFTSIRRVVRKGSPFAADRSHIHHLMQDLGFSDRRALVLIVSVSLSMTFLGLMLHRANVPESYKFAIFIASFGLYSLLCSQAWRVAARLKEQTTQIHVAFSAEPQTDITQTTTADVFTDGPSTAPPETKITSLKRQ